MPANVTFNSGNTEKTFTFTAAHDTVDDDGESVKLTFGDLPTRVTKGTTGESAVSITDDDDPEVTVSFQKAAYTVAEGGAVEIKVTLNADPEREVTITITTDNEDGASDADYSGVPVDVTFQSGEIEKKFTVNATQDTVDDDDESVNLGFDTLPFRVAAGTTSNATVNITDDDVPFVKVDFANGTGTVQEGYNMGVKVVLDVDPERTVTIPIIATEHDGATHHDYSVPGSVTFNSGETEAYPVFNAVHDEIDEDDERVVLSFGTPLPHRVSVGNPGMTDITITDDDGDQQGQAILVTFRTGKHTLPEGDSAEPAVKLSRAADADLTISLKLRHFDGIDETDYSGVPDSVEFARGVTEATFTVTAVDDTLAEQDETLDIGFRDLPDAVEVGIIFGTAIIIEDDDKAGTTVRNQCPSDSGTRIILERVGTISQAGESDFWAVKLDPYVVYLVEVLGSDYGADVTGNDTYSGDLTLADPDLIGFWKDNRSTPASLFNPIVHDGAYGRNSIAVVRESFPGTYHFEVASGDGGTGTYQIKVRVNDVCTTENGYAQYPWFGGPDGYDELDLPADTSTDRTLFTAPGIDNHPSSQGAYLGDNWDWYWDNVPDEDWFRIELTQDYEYTVEVWNRTDVAETHQATDLKVLGIHDSNGNAISGTANAGTSVSVMHRPGSTGMYYVAVGSFGADRTGLYSIRVVGILVLAQANLEDPNSPATGWPSIRGTPQVGETLTADTSGIADPDGLDNTIFTYQWVSHDLFADEETDIQGATDSTYTLKPQDEGKSVKVQVSFTDDAGNKETVSSFLLVVSPPPLLTVSLTEAPDAHDGVNAFSLRIAFSSPISTPYRKVRDHAFQVTGGTVINASRVEGDSRLWNIQVQPDSDTEVTILLQAERPCNE